MDSHRAALSLGLGALLLVGCAQTAPPPVGPTASALGVGFRHEIPVFPDDVAQEVHFVRVDDADALGLILSTNYFADGYAFLTNVPPGRYAVVAGSFHRSYVQQPTTGTTMNTTNTWDTEAVLYLGRADSERATVTVLPGQVAFVGEVVVEKVGRWGHADEQQHLYYSLMAPDEHGRNVLLKLIDDEVHQPIQALHIENGPEAREKFRTAARESLGKEGWSPALTGSVGAGPR